MTPKSREAIPLEDAEAAVQHAPGDGAAWRRLGQAYAQAGFSDLAASVLEEAVRLRPDDLPARVDLGAELVQCSRFEDGLRHLQDVVRRDPRSAARWYFLGLAFERAGRLGPAVDCLRKALRLDADLNGGLRTLGQTLLNDGKPAEAIVVLDAATLKQPRDALLWRLLGLAHATTNQHRRAVASYLVSIEIEPLAPETHCDLGGSYEKLDRLDEAERAFTECVRLDPKVALAHAGLGWIALRRGHPAEAVAHLRRAVCLKPADPYAWHVLADAFGDLGDRRNQIEAARQRARVAPTVDSLVYLAVVQHEASRDGQAVAPLEEALRIDPRNPDVLAQLGMVLATLGCLPDAEKLLRQALAIDPSFGGAWHNLGLVLVRQERREAALQVFETASRLLPDFAPAWIELGCLYRDSRLHSKAAEAFRRVAQLVPNDVKAWWSLGSVLDRAGDADGVLEVHGRLLALDPVTAARFHDEHIAGRPWAPR